MFMEKTQEDSSITKQSKNTLALELNDNQAELLAQIPWFNERFLLPGEEVSSYDLQLQRLIDSVEVKDALDLILVKDIHDELREVQRMRALRQSVLLRGMEGKLGSLLSGFFELDDNPRSKLAFLAWENDPEEGYQHISKLLDEAEITMNGLMAEAYTLKANTLDKVEQQLARHEKNVRETLKMIDTRRNHALVRQRLEFDLEQDRQQLLIDKNDNS